MGHALASVSVPRSRSTAGWSLRVEALHWVSPNMSESPHHLAEFERWSWQETRATAPFRSAASSRSRLRERQHHEARKLLARGQLLASGPPRRDARVIDVHHLRQTQAGVQERVQV